MSGTDDGYFIFDTNGALSSFEIKPPELLYQNLESCLLKQKKITKVSKDTKPPFQANNEFYNI